MQGAKTKAEGSILEVCDQSRMSQATQQFVHSDAPHNKDTQIQAKQLPPFFLSWDLGMATASKFRRLMSAVGTTLLHSPGWNEGKARYGTLGK